MDSSPFSGSSSDEDARMNLSESPLGGGSSTYSTPSPISPLGALSRRLQAEEGSLIALVPVVRKTEATRKPKHLIRMTQELPQKCWVDGGCCRRLPANILWPTHQFSPGFPQKSFARRPKNLAAGVQRRPYLSVESVEPLSGQSVQFAMEERTDIRYRQ